MPKLYFAGPRDLPTVTPQEGLTFHVIQAEHATIAIVDLAPKVVLETHKHDVEQIGVVTRGSLAMVVAGEQRILTPGDSYRIPAGTAHGIRVFEDATQVIDVYAPRRNDLGEVRQVREEHPGQVRQVREEHPGRVRQVREEHPGRVRQVREEERPKASPS